MKISKRQPKVCICIPNYNNEKTIGTMLDSILAQTYKNILIKVFDNSSTDKSYEILCNYQNKYSNILIFKNEENIGGEGNFTKCIQNMEGDYGAVYHSDDIYLPTMVEEQVKALMFHKISAVFVNAYRIDQKNEIIGREYSPLGIASNKLNFLNYEQLLSTVLKYDNFLICPSCMSSVDLYKDYIKVWDGGGFKTAADLDVWLRFSRFEKIGIIGKYLMKYRVSQNSHTYRIRKSRVERQDIFLVLNKYLNFESATPKQKRLYNFLLLKDNILIVFNKIITLNFKDIDKYPIEILSLKNIVSATSNLRFFKFYIFGVILKIVLILKLEENQRLVELLYRVRFKESLDGREGEL